MKNPVKSLCAGALFVAALCAVGVFSTGCEWESSGSEGSWSDSMSWVNFSGLYRSGSGSRPLVSNFSLTSGGTGDDTGDENILEYGITGQAGGTQSRPITVLTGVIPFMNSGVGGWSIKPGSVSINLEAVDSGSQGQFDDNAGGGLSGSFAQVPPSPPINGGGTIDYDTGAWRVNLDAVYIDDAVITYSYVVLQDLSVAPGGGTTTDEDPPTSGDWVYTLQVVQTGNRLSFTDNRGFTWEGVLSSVTTPAGDDSGASPGDVVGTFDVKGVTDSRYKITGTFSGSYLVFAPDEGVTYGQLTSRRAQGIWMEPTGNGDLYGETSDAEQAAVATTTTE